MRQGNLYVLHALLAHKDVQVNLQNHYDMTALMYAAAYCDGAVESLTTRQDVNLYLRNKANKVF